MADGDDDVAGWQAEAWEDSGADGVENDDVWDSSSDTAAGDGAWAGSSWAEEGQAMSGDDAPAADWLSAAAPEPAKRTKPIETIKVGLVQTPYKRRNGYHVEVAVQHASREESIHRLWFGFEVLDDVAKLRGGDRFDVNVEQFGEAVVTFLQQRGVDLADEDWGMQDDSIPFSTQHLPMRTLFEYYPDLPEALAEACLATLHPKPEDAPRPMSGADFDVPIVLDRPFIDRGEQLRSSRDALQAAVDRGFIGVKDVKEKKGK